MLRYGCKGESEMKERIERLKKNRVPWRWLCADDQQFIAELLDAQIVVLDCDDVWIEKCQRFAGRKIYRIHEDYNPEPDKPVFPGYVLCEVIPQMKHCVGQKGFIFNGEYPLNEAVNFGCGGYVFKERLDVLWDSPIAFIDKGGAMYAQGNVQSLRLDGVKPATLGWVVFKEEKE